MGVIGAAGEGVDEEPGEETNNGDDRRMSLLYFKLEYISTEVPE